MQINNSYTLRKIAEITGGKCIGNVDSTINNIHFDSRRFVKNNKHLFIAFKTNFNDGHLYINKVYKSGIKQFITHTKPDDLKSDAGYLIVNNTLIALQKWASFHREKFNFPVLSISGSYGKTVIKEWINFIAEEKLNIIRSPKSYNSQFGAALTLLSIKENHQLTIVETGISKPGEMSLMKKMIQPSHVILTNIGNEHLENFNSIDELRLEKEKILENTCFTYFKDYKQLDSNRSIKENGQEISWIYNQKKETFFLRQKDEFSAKNFICCLSFLNQIGFDVQEIKKLSPFLPEIALRFEKKAGINQSTIFNDSYQNNIQSLKIALETLKSESGSSKSTLILGDLDEKNINYNDLVDLIKSYKLYRFVGIGKEIYKNRKSFIGESSFFEDESSFFKKFNSLRQIFLRSLMFSSLNTIISLKRLINSGESISEASATILSLLFLKNT